MLTTTPFFRPREGWLPSPISSIAPSAVISPTSASTFEVPISSPTITSLPARLAIAAYPRHRCEMRRAALPADREPIAVAHVYVGDVGRALAHEPRCGTHEALEALIHLRAPEAHHDSVIE